MSSVGSGRPRSSSGARGIRSVAARDQDALLAAIAGSRLVVYESAGHALHWEEPERFAADLVAFAESLAADP